MKSEKTRKVVLTDLSQLSTLDEVMREIDASAIKLEVPDFSTISQDVEKQARALAQVRENIGIALESLRVANNTIAKYSMPQEGVDEDTHMDMLRLATAKITNGRTKAQNYLDGVFSSRDIHCRQTAAVAYVRTSLAQTFQTTTQAWEAFHDLVKRGILLENSTGKIVVCYKHYDLASGFEFDENHVARIGEAIGKFTRHLMTLVAEERRVATVEMSAQADISLTEAIAGKDCSEGLVGKCLVDVPAEHYTYCKTHRQKNCTLNKGCDIETQHRGGGKILVEFTEKDLIPLQVTGSCERVVNEMIQLNIRLPKYTLKWELAPGAGRKEQFQAMSRTIAHNLRISVEDAVYYLRGEQLLWYMIHRSILKLLADERTAAEKKEMEKEAVVESDEFFAGTAGVAFLEVEGMFKDNGHPIPNIFLLATNDGEEIEILKVPSHLKGLLGEFVGKAFPTADNFESLPDILRRIFRLLANRANRDRQIAQAQAESMPTEVGELASA